MSIIEQKCKEKGVRLTDHRKVIAKVLSESKEVYWSKDNPDVYELHKRVTDIDDKISIAADDKVTQMDSILLYGEPKEIHQISIEEINDFNVNESISAVGKMRHRVPPCHSLSNSNT